MTNLDYLALAYFLTCWTFFGWLTGGERQFARQSLTRLMNDHREIWLRNSLRRDLKMIDTSIIAGLQNGTAFFASTSILAIGGCFALLGATEQVFQVFSDLPIPIETGRAAFEIKVGGLIAIFGYAFFKFGWAYRLFNYGSILFGTLPMTDDALRDPDAAEVLVKRAIAMNTLGGKHFNAGLRAIFLSIGYLGWFISPAVLAASTTLVFFVLIRRQFFSRARAVLLEETAAGQAASQRGEKS